MDEFRPHPRKIEPKEIPPAPSGHGRRLRDSFVRAVQEAAVARNSLPFSVRGAKSGTYVTFKSRPDTRIPPQSLQHATRKIELVAMRTDRSGEGGSVQTEVATVFVPSEKDDHFTKRFDAYLEAEDQPEPQRPKRDFINRVASINLAALRGLWTDPIDAFPNESETVWWEIWLRRRDHRSLERLMEFADAQQIKVSDRRLEFDDRIVTMVQASAEDLGPALLVMDDLAELRATKTVAGFFIDMGNPEQAQWSADLLDRCQAPEPSAPAVCILDTGVNYGHPLLEGLLDPTDCHTYDPRWSVGDHHGHGTEMAGLAAYGDLTEALAASGQVCARNVLESVKILPPAGKNPPSLYGAISADATSRVEIQAPERRRTFAMAVTADDQTDRGQPTSWSVAIDALAAGRSFDPSTSRLVYLDDDSSHARLFVLSAGNVGQPEVAHLDRSDSDPVQDPAQAWNALTVGAYTDKVHIEDPAWATWTPVSAEGELAPWSTTSVAFRPDSPIKPDIVVEGGNAAHDGAGSVDACPDLSVLSTHRDPTTRFFVETAGTSPATAQAARIAAAVMGEYPDYWPETVRAILVHCAQWTPTMRGKIGGQRKKSTRAQLVRRYGFGVPTLARALHSANDALTLVAQRSIHPFLDGAYREIHFYELPWPKDVLAELGEVEVRLRVTLSYFIEPNPARKAWKDRYRYASYGLRFDLREATEKQSAFRKRLNKHAMAEGEAKPTRDSSSSDWCLGEARWRGSLHADILTSTAADLALRGAIAVYPVVGWWKDHKKRDRSDLGVRYSLVVSLETDAHNVDLWTPVAKEVGIPTAVEIPV